MKHPQNCNCAICASKRQNETRKSVCCNSPVMINKDGLYKCVECGLDCSLRECEKCEGKGYHLTTDLSAVSKIQHFNEACECERGIKFGMLMQQAERKGVMKERERIKKKIADFQLTI